MQQCSGRNPHIMLLDGDPSRAARRCGHLTSAGWHVTQAVDELEALQAAHRLELDLALLHLPLHEAVAMDLPRVLRRVATGTYLPVVVLADQPSEDDRCRFLECGADEILSDQVSPMELLARLRALFRVKELQDALDSSRRALQDALLRERELLAKVRADNAQLTEMVVTDPLTRLHNVRYFQKFMEDEFKIARRYGHSISLLVLDLDHFKMVNDRYGHPAGDFVLKEFSVIMRQNVRESDVVARTGGEEFAVVLPRADRVQADHFARRIREEMAQHAFVIGQTRIKATCSIGLASYPQDADITSAEQLVYFADQALLLGKQAGRNCVVHWFEMDAALKARLRAQASGKLPTVEPAPAPPADQAGPGHPEPLPAGDCRMLASGAETAK